MRIANVNYNDINNAIDGVVISVWVQGCPHKCPGCHNPETWSLSGGPESINSDHDKIEFFKKNIYDRINENGIKRNISILGGEPLFEVNESFTFDLIMYVKTLFPDRKIYLWTGYSMEELISKYKSNRAYMNLLHSVDYLITDRFLQDKRDPSLRLRGSTNQRIWTSVNKLFSKKKKFINITNKIDRMSKY